MLRKINCTCTKHVATSCANSNKEFSKQCCCVFWILSVNFLTLCNKTTDHQSDILDPLIPDNDTFHGVLGTLLVEAFGTGILTFFILSLTSPALPTAFRDNATLFFISVSIDLAFILFLKHFFSPCKKTDTHLGDT